MTITDFATLILAIATTTSLIYISRQVRVTRQQTKGEFLLALDDQFEKTNRVTLQLVNDPTFKPTSDDWIEIFRLMSVFERINIMVEDEILDAALVDRLHGFRLLNLIANDDVFARVQASGADWQDFIDLCYAVADHRMQMVPTDDRDKAFYERVHQLSKQTRSLKNPFSTQSL
jgi:hypothetical protein